ncbi:hypothetical protein V1477_006604 [Vespula maculifrons]|uniref:Uncharacterized protein n=1 Tax=Vespula maculifrons TaxID=7453 RepID=A0ABD2CJD1_VESMC
MNQVLIYQVWELYTKRNNHKQLKNLLLYKYTNLHLSSCFKILETIYIYKVINTCTFTTCCFLSGILDKFVATFICRVPETLSLVSIE